MSDWTDSDQLHRAAEACRNASAKPWFQWVPAYLDTLADRLAPDDGNRCSDNTPGQGVAS